MNTDPRPPAPRSIAGYAVLKEASLGSGASGAGTSVPSAKRTARGMGRTGSYAPKKRASGGDPMAGPGFSKTSQGTNSPKSKTGTGGMGRTGKGAPWGR